MVTVETWRRGNCTNGSCTPRKLMKNQSSRQILCWNGCARAARVGFWLNHWFCKARATPAPTGLAGASAAVAQRCFPSVVRWFQEKIRGLTNKGEMTNKNRDLTNKNRDSSNKLGILPTQIGIWPWKLGGFDQQKREFQPTIGMNRISWTSSARIRGVRNLGDPSAWI